MASSGSCSTTSATNQNCYMTFSWTQTQNASKNQSTISWSMTGHLSYGHVIVSEMYVYINGSRVCYHSTADHTDVYNGTVKASGTTTITHAADGTASLSVSIGAGIYNWATNCYGSGSWTLNPIETYSLSLSAGEGSVITVSRTSSGYGATGSLSNDATLYYNDILKIAFTPSENYAIETHTVNGDTFISGNSHTVGGDVGVVTTASPIKSHIAATDANIGSTSIISITKYNNNYTHTVTYTFGDQSGTIVTKASRTQIAWSVPEEFYAQIPNSKTGVCTLTCVTYSGDTNLGSSTCTLTVTADSESCSPTVSGTVEDTNETTIAITGGAPILIRYKSTAKCEISATPKNSATITSVKINGYTPTNGVYSFSEVAVSSFVFEATDSRGYTSTYTVSPQVVAYIELTCNPIISRVSSGAGDVVMTFTGNYYNGSFSDNTNTLSIRYRYKETDAAAYGSWTTVQPTYYTVGTGSYSTSGPVPIGSDFDYRNTYVVQVNAYDGAGGTVLSSIEKTIPVRKGVPTFDWGEDDFAFHVPVSFSDPVAVSCGGTGASSAEDARDNLGLGNVATDDIVPVSRGGTGAESAGDARTNLGLGDVATDDIASILHGGTGASDESGARENLCVPIRPAILWSGTWSSGSLTIAKTGGSAGCTGLGNLTDYKYIVMRVGVNTLAAGGLVDVTGGVCTWGAFGTNGGATQNIVYAATMDRSGNKLTVRGDGFMWQNVWDDNYGSGAITEIVGLVRNDDILTL